MKRRSGGIGTNIGIHLFDAVTWLFGKVVEINIGTVGDESLGGYIKLERADVRFYLSISSEISARRVFRIDGEQIDLGGAFGELHNAVYQRSVSGCGYGIRDTWAAIELAEKIRDMARVTKA